MIHFKCKAQETKPEQKKTHEGIVNHYFTCVIKIKRSRNKLTVAEDDRHQREKQHGKSNSRKSIS